MKTYELMHPEEMKLWDELMSLVENNEAYFYADHFYLTHWFRIFNYRLASYTDFLQPSALECRGLMFEIDIEGKDADPIKLVARPMQKFFNMNENPTTMDIDLYDVEQVFDKADGSLITTYMIDGVIHAKSKGALQSDQAMAASRLLNSGEYDWFLEEVQAFHMAGSCVNMEYVAPDNRIVIGYPEPKLIVLNVRDLVTGDYWPYSEVEASFRENACFQYTPFDGGEGVEPKEAMLKFLGDLPNATGIEGVVVTMRDGLWMKIKTEAYLTAHRAKDSINSPRRLFEAVLEEATDDLRSLFFDDEVALMMIEEMETRVEKIYNHAVDSVERFYERNKHMERKEYAIAGQAELDRPLFGLAMNKFLGKEVDYKAFLRKNYKQFGIKDDPEPTGDE